MKSTMSTRSGQTSKPITSGTKTLKEHFSQNGSVTNKPDKLNNTQLLREISAKLTTLTDNMSDVKDEIVNIKSTIRDVVVEELSIREKVWDTEKENIMRKIKELEQKDELREKSSKKITSL